MEASLTPFTKQWKKAGVVVEIDTDGILLDQEPNLKAINDFIAGEVQRRCMIQAPTLEMEEEKFERGFIHKMKNYMLIEKTKKGNIKEILHGAYFKSSRTAKVYDDSVRNIAEWALYDRMTELQARERSLDIRMRPVEDFVMRVRLSKNLKEYNTIKTEFYEDSGAAFNPITSEIAYTSNFSLSGNQIVALGMQYHRLTGSVPEKGTTIYYITAVDPLTGKKMYEFFNTKDETLTSRINYNAYEEQIKKLFEATDVASYKKIGQEDNWLEDYIN